jgi:hypothetical protein
MAAVAQQQPVIQRPHPLRLAFMQDPPPFLARAIKH